MTGRYGAGGTYGAGWPGCSHEELYRRRFWIDRATLTRRLDEIRADNSAQDGLDNLLRLYAAVYQTGWSEVLGHPLFAHVDHEAAMRRVPPGADGESTLLVAVATAALVPFIQSIATAAGSRAFEEARTRVVSVLGRRQNARDFPAITIHEDETGLLSFKAWCRYGLTLHDPCGMPTA